MSCRVAPRGWHCTRTAGHGGPCAAWPRWWNLRGWWPHPSRLRGVLAMTDLVDPEEIEEIVGAPRHEYLHLARWVTGHGTVYIMHSRQCRDSGIDLRDCSFSRALDEGVAGSFPPDRRVVAVSNGRLHAADLVGDGAWRLIT